MQFKDSVIKTETQQQDAVEVLENLINKYFIQERNKVNFTPLRLNITENQTFEDALNLTLDASDSLNDPKILKHIIPGKSPTLFIDPYTVHNLKTPPQHTFKH